MSVILPKPLYKRERENTLPEVTTRDKLRVVDKAYTPLDLVPNYGKPVQIFTNARPGTQPVIRPVRYTPIYIRRSSPIQPLFRRADQHRHYSNGV